MKSIFILDPNDMRTPVTQFVGRGAGILAHIELLEIVADAQVDVHRMIEAAREAGETEVIIGEPLTRARAAVHQLMELSVTN